MTGPTSTHVPDEGELQGPPVRRRPTLGTPLAVAYGVASLVAVLAWAVVGDTRWTILPNLATFWWSAPGVVLLAVAVLRRRRLAAAALLVPAIVWIWSYAGALVPDEGPPVAADLRVATFNTFVGAPGVQHVVALVAAHRPDVLVLQEVFPGRQGTLARRLGDRYPHRVVVQSPGVGGVAVLSRFPVTAREPVADAVSTSRSTAVVTLDVDGRALQVVPAHLLSPCPTCDRDLGTRLAVESSVRSAEVDGILDALDPRVPAVVAGDLNSTERSDPYRRLVAAGFRDPQREAGEGFGFTWPAHGPVGALLRIDWILVRGLVPVDAFVGDPGRSDHRPVIVDLVFPEA